MTVDKMQIFVLQIYHLWFKLAPPPTVTTYCFHTNSSVLIMM